MAPDSLAFDAIRVEKADNAVLIDDPILADATPVAHDLARHHCRTDPATGESCAWYHGYRLYKSLLSGKSPPAGQRSSGGWTAAHGTFFGSAFAALTRAPGFHRVLVSASSDYMMPSLAYDTYRRGNAPVDITLVDICETPLKLSQWYAARRGFAIRTERSDIFDFAPARPFDALCTHHFLNFIAPARRAELFRKWRGMLRPGGRAVIVNSIRPDDASGAAGEYTPFAKDQFVAAVRAMRRNARFVMPTTEELVEVLLERDARKRFEPVRSGEEVADTMAEAGFVIERLEELDCSFAAVAGAARLPRKKGTFGLVAVAA